MAVDYGEKRIGLAMSDPLRMFAKPYTTLENISYQHILENLNRILLESQVGLIVIGIPWGLDGEKTITTELTLAFIERIRQDVSIPVEGWDERYSSNDANELLKTMGYNWKQARKVIDSMAACLILKHYMEKNCL
jgi:putative Holliday junction resolvase